MTKKIVELTSNVTNAVSAINDMSGAGQRLGKTLVGITKEIHTLEDGVPKLTLKFKELLADPTLSGETTVAGVKRVNTSPDLFKSITGAGILDRSQDYVQGGTGTILRKADAEKNTSHLVGAINNMGSLIVAAIGGNNRSTGGYVAGGTSGTTSGG